MFWFKRRRREKIGRQAFSSDWRALIAAEVPYYSMLPPADREELERHMLIFVAEKKFEGCFGQKITDEIRLIIAAQACLLLLHRQTDYYPGLKSILVYPHAFERTESEHLSSGFVIEGDEERLGESHHRGPIVLSWDDVLYGLRDPHDGENVVFHEFAHQLDSTAGKGDSSPVFASRESFLAWSGVLDEEYHRLCLAVDDETPHFLDEYGAENPAEFFAVATETFFEQPIDLRIHHADLYDALRDFYQQDPAGWGR